MGLVDNLMRQFQEQHERANAANEQRFQQGMEIFDRIIAQQEAGGTFEKATEAAIERGRTKSVAQGTQALVSSGLASTTTAAGLGKKYEEEVGTPARLQAADIQSQRLMQALTGKAGFIERREDVGPSFSDIAGLARSIGAGQQARPVSRQITSNSGYAELGRMQRETSARKSAAQGAIDQRRFQARQAELNRQAARDQQRRQMQASLPKQTAKTRATSDYLRKRMGLPA